jgi:hypothetical protein
MLCFRALLVLMGGTPPFPIQKKVAAVQAESLPNLAVSWQRFESGSLRLLWLENEQRMILGNRPVFLYESFQ